MADGYNRQYVYQRYINNIKLMSFDVSFGWNMHKYPEQNWIKKLDDIAEMKNTHRMSFKKSRLFMVSKKRKKWC